MPTQNGQESEHEAEEASAKNKVSPDWRLSKI